MYDWGLFIIQNTKIKVQLKYGWGLKLLKKKKKSGIAGVSIYFKC